MHPMTLKVTFSIICTSYYPTIITREVIVLVELVNHAYTRQEKMNMMHF